MTEEDKNNPADGPGEAVIDEPTEHALDPAKDPNNEWEEDAAEQITESGPAGGSDGGVVDGSKSDDSGTSDSESESADPESAEPEASDSKESGS